MKASYSALDLEKCINEDQKIEQLSLIAFTENSTVLKVKVGGMKVSKNMAIKIYNQNSSPPTILYHLISKQFKHIINIYRITDQQPVCVCMQLCTQDLKEYIKSRSQPLPYEEVFRVMREITEGLIDLKSLKLMHGDLKPQNILVGQRSITKIGDLDYILREQEFTRKKIRVGTLHYMAPQVLSDWSCSYASDVWSLGVVLFYLYFGRHPFPQIQELEYTKQSSIPKALTLIRDHLDKIRAYIKNTLKDCFQPIPNILLEVMLKCLVWSASSRANLEDIVNLLQVEKRQRKGSQSTDYSAIHHEDDIFMFPNTGLLLAFQKLHTILSYLPEEAAKFKEILHIIDQINSKEQYQHQKINNEELTALKNLIQSKYKKMQRNFKRLSNLEGGIMYSNKRQLFIHIKYLLELIEQAIKSNENKQWANQNGTKSAQFLG